MIPPDECERLRECVREAGELAERGEVVRGYGVLKLGPTWAETPALHPVTLEPAPPEPWAAALAALHRDELVRYASAYQRVLESSDLTEHRQALRHQVQEQGATPSAGPKAPALPKEPVANATQQLRVARERGTVH